MRLRRQHESKNFYLYFKLLYSTGEKNFRLKYTILYVFLSVSANVQATVENDSRKFTNTLIYCTF